MDNQNGFPITTFLRVFLKESNRCFHQIYPAFMFYRVQLLLLLYAHGRPEGALALAPTPGQGYRTHEIRGQRILHPTNAKPLRQQGHPAPAN